MENIENNQKNIPVKSLVISLVVLILIVVGLTSGPGISRPELQLAQVSTVDNLCKVKFNITLKNKLQTVSIYRLVVIGGSATYSYDVNFSTSPIQVTKLSPTNPTLTITGTFPTYTVTGNFSPVQVAGQVQCRYTIRLTPKLRGQLFENASATLKVTGTVEAPLPSLLPPIPAGVSNSFDGGSQFQGGGGVGGGGSGSGTF